MKFGWIRDFAVIGHGNFAFTDEPFVEFKNIYSNNRICIPLTIINKKIKLLISNNEEDNNDDIEDDIYESNFLNIV